MPAAYCYTLNLLPPLLFYCRSSCSLFSPFVCRFFFCGDLSWPLSLCMQSPKARVLERSGAANQFHSGAVINEGCGETATSFSDSKNSHPWPEWSKFANLPVEKGYTDRCITSGDDDDSFLVDEDLPEEFLKAAEACLGFARDCPNILRKSLTRVVAAVTILKYQI